jgi:hypothetical protein
MVVTVLVAALVFRLFGAELLRWRMTPTAAFTEIPQPTGLTYADRQMWIARPDIADSPASWSPAGIARDGTPRAAVFFIHPTSYLESSAWNASISDPVSQQRARLFVRSQASAFNHVGEIWVPKYRQAAFGAFLTTKDDAQKALDFAYRDVRAAFDAFLEQVPKGRPIILAGHSQGSLHLTRLLKERVAGSREASRVVAAYVVGWPISVSADLPALGLPACQSAEQSGCILSWQSFAEPADPKMVTQVYDASDGLTGTSRDGTDMLCVNPMTGAAGGAAGADANLGTLIPNAALTDATLAVPGVPARCGDRGFLLIGEDEPDLGPYKLPGNNYHVYDYALFWANIRADADTRLKSFLSR